MLDACQVLDAPVRDVDLRHGFDLRVGHVVLAVSQIVNDPLAEDGIGEVGFVDLQITGGGKFHRHAHHQAVAHIIKSIWSRQFWD